MRTFTITNTNCTVLGTTEDRVVKANREDCALRGLHLMSRPWHASAAGRATAAFKRWVAAAVTGAADILGIYLPGSRPQLCRQPVQSSRLPASSRA